VRIRGSVAPLGRPDGDNHSPWPRSGMGTLPPTTAQLLFQLPDRHEPFLREVSNAVSSTMAFFPARWWAHDPGQLPASSQHSSSGICTPDTSSLAPCTKKSRGAPSHDSSGPTHELGDFEDHEVLDSWGEEYSDEEQVEPPFHITLIRTRNKQKSSSLQGFALTWCGTRMRPQTLRNARNV
jgi:hypothetical protein